MSAYPEHEKLETIADKSQACGEFMEWLTAQGIVLAKYHFHTDECHEEGRRWPVCGMSNETLYPTYTNLTDLLARHFGIDQNKIDAEKRAILEEIRAAAAKEPSK